MGGTKQTSRYLHGNVGKKGVLAAKKNQFVGIPYHSMTNCVVTEQLWTLFANFFFAEYFPDRFFSDQPNATTKKEGDLTCNSLTACLTTLSPCGLLFANLMNID